MFNMDMCLSTENPSYVFSFVFISILSFSSFLFLSVVIETTFDLISLETPQRVITPVDNIKYNEGAWEENAREAIDNIRIFGE